MDYDSFKKNLELVREFGKEKINSKSFEEYLTNEEQYFKIIEMWVAALVIWGKTSFVKRIKEKMVFNYRKFKSYQRKKELQPNPEKGGIVFFPIGESHVTLFQSIISKLKKQKERNYVLRFDYSRNGLREEFEKKNIPYKNFEAYLDEETLKKIKGKREKYKKSLEFIKILLKRKTKYKKLIPAFEYYFGSRNRFYEIIEFVEGIKNFIDKEKPSIFILPDEFIDIGRAVSYICKKKKIPCLVMQHGLISNDLFESKETFANKKIVFGKFAKDFLISIGMPNEKIVVTGSPVYDSLINEKISEQDKRMLRDKFGIGDEKVILFASTWNLERAERRLRILFKIVKKIPNLKIIIKQHPSEYHQKKFEKFYLEFAKKYGVSVIVSKRNMGEMLQISDIYITDFSTTVLEALILKKPIILTNFEKEFTYENYPEFPRLIWHADNYDDVYRAIINSLKYKPSEKQEEFRKKIIKSNIYRDDGKATERIVELIKKWKK